MTGHHVKRFSRLGLSALAAVALLAACGPGSGSSSTTVVLTGPAEKVQALMTQHKLQGAPIQVQVEKLDDGRQRATLTLPKGLPLHEVVDLGRDAANSGVSYEFSSGTKWGSGDAPPGGDHPQAAPAKPGERVV